MNIRKSRNLTAIVCALCIGTLALTAFVLRSEIGLIVAEYRHAARLRSGEASEWRAAVQALGEIKTAGAAEVLVDELTRTSGSSTVLIDALANIGPPAVPALNGMLEGDSLGERKRWAVIALGRIGPRSAPAVPAILAFLEAYAEEWLCRASTFVALGRIGPDAGEAVPILLERVSTESDADIRRHLATALLRIEPYSLELQDVAAPLLVVPEDESPAPTPAPVPPTRAEMLRLVEEGQSIEFDISGER